MRRRETTGGSRGRYAMRCVSAIALLLLFALAAFGQDGSITGNIADPQGGATPNASIDAKNADTGTVYHGGASGSGNYVIPVPAGRYQLTVKAMGFKTFVRENLEVSTANATRQDVKLELGALTDTITVTDEAPLLHTESGEISHDISTDDVNQLPLLTTAGGSWAGASAFGNIRNPLQEILILPGTNFSNDNILVVNGLPANSENIRIEGQDSTSTIWKVMQQNSQGGVDAIQEVAIQTSNFAAEYGQAAGGYFNYTMKSGTNQYHGSAYDYLVNEALNAGEPFTNAGLTNSLKDGQHIRNSVRRNDYGFTIGGPVRIPKLFDGRNRTFFFVNFEQFRQNNTTSGSLSTMPLPAWQGTGGANANFSAAQQGPVLQSNFVTPVVDPTGNPLFVAQVYDPNTTRILPGSGVQVRTPFAGDIIPYSRLDKVSLAIAALMPAPNTGTVNQLTNNYIVPTYTGYQHTTNVSIKLDQSLSSTMKLSGYYSQLSTQNPNANGFSGSLLALGGATPTNTWNHTTRVNYDWTVTPTLLFHAGIGFFDTSEPNIPPQQNQSTIGLTGYYDPTRFPSITGADSFFNFYGGYGGPGIGPGFTAYIWEQKPTATTSLTWIRGNHTFKVGGEYVGEGFPEQSLWRANGAFTFSNAETADPYQNTIATSLSGFFGHALDSGFNYASFMLGLPDSLAIDPATAVRLGDHSLGFYLQDSWKITHKLTLDYGLRYDYETYMKEQYGRMQDASFTTPNANAGGRDGAVVYEGGPTPVSAFSHNYPYAWGPRIGGAYQIDSKTVLRGGAGLQYDAVEAPNGIVYSTADYFTLNPNAYGVSPLQSFGGLQSGNPFTNGNLAPVVWPNFNQSKYPIQNGGIYTPLSPFIFFDPHNRPGRIFTWSIGVQREVLKNLVAEVSYVGNRGAYFPAPDADQMTSNSLTPAGLLANDGLNVTSTTKNNCPVGVATGSASCLTDAQLLQQPLTSPLVQARFPQFANQVLINGVPTTPAVYPGFPSSQSLTQALRPVPQWNGGVLPWLGPPLGDTWYDSMQVKVTKRFSHGLQAQGNFTWAKGLVNGASSDSTYFLGGAPAENDIYNFGQNKQLNQYVAPLAMTITATYTTPKFSATGAAMRLVSQVTRDWQLGTVLRYQSGSLIEVPTSNNALGTQLGRATQTFWNVNPGVNPFTVDPNCGCFNPQSAIVLNPAAWTDAPAGQFGASAPFYNSYRWQRHPAESMSFARNFRVGKEGKYTLQLRVEFQNVFNRLFLSAPSSGNPNTALGTTTYSGQTINNTGFGVISTLGGGGDQPRSGQAVMRFQF